MFRLGVGNLFWLEQDDLLQFGGGWVGRCYEHSAMDAFFSSGMGKLSAHRWYLS